MERFNHKHIVAALGLLIAFTGCGNDNNGGSNGVDTGRISAGDGNGMLSAIPAFTLKKDGSYAPVAYATDTPLELVECTSDSDKVLVGCSTDNAIVNISAVALTGADATTVHFQVKNTNQTFDRVEVPILIKSSCQEIQDSGLAQGSAVYIVHNPADPAGTNTEVSCTF